MTFPAQSVLLANWVLQKCHNNESAALLRPFGHAGYTYFCVGFWPLFCAAALLRPFVLQKKWFLLYGMEGPQKWFHWVIYNNEIGTRSAALRRSQQGTPLASAFRVKGVPQTCRTAPTVRSDLSPHFCFQGLAHKQSFEEQLH